MGLEGLFNSIIPMSALFGFVVILFFAMKSKSDGSEILKLFKKKRFLGLEISQGFLALSEGMLAAAIGMEMDHVPYGVRLTGHIALICTSAFAGFQLGDQVKEARQAVDDQDNVFKEVLDAVFSVILTILPPFANVAYIAISLKAYRDIENFFTFQWGRIGSAIVALTCLIFIIHVFVVFYLATATAEKRVKATVDPGGVTDPLAQASDSDIDDDADNNDSGLITTLPVPTTFDPEKVDVENYLVENFQVDRQRLHHRLLVNPTFKRSISSLVTEALTFREEWENAKAGISEAMRKIETNEKRIGTIEKNTYGFDKDNPGRVYIHLSQETKDLKEINKQAQKEADLAETNYNSVLDEINNELSVV